MNLAGKARLRWLDNGWENAQQLRFSIVTSGPGLMLPRLKHPKPCKPYTRRDRKVPASGTWWRPTPLPEAQRCLDSRVAIMLLDLNSGLGEESHCHVSLVLLGLELRA